MNINDLKTEIIKSITSVKRSEQNTRKQLSMLSRSLLVYVGQHGQDVELVNRLISALTPMNRHVAGLYFEHFLPYKLEDNGLLKAEKLKKEKTILAKAKDLEAWLEVETNDIWVWADKNVDIKAKAFDLNKVLVSALGKAKKAQSNPDDFEEVKLHVDQKTILEMLAFFSEVSPESANEVFQDQPSNDDDLDEQLKEEFKKVG